MLYRNLILAGIMGASMIGAGVAQAATLREEGPRPFDPVLSMAERMAPRNEFFLDSNEDVELIRFTTPRDNDLCVPRTTYDKSLQGRRQKNALKVTWDNNTAVVKPGHCLSFDAKSVKVRPADPLGNDEELVGTIRTHK